MYAIYAYIERPNHPNVGIYGIHGVSGVCYSRSLPNVMPFMTCRVLLWHAYGRRPTGSPSTPARTGISVLRSPTFSGTSAIWTSGGLPRGLSADTALPAAALFTCSELPKNTCWGLGHDGTWNRSCGTGHGLTWNRSGAERPDFRRSKIGQVGACEVLLMEEEACG